MLPRLADDEPFIVRFPFIVVPEVRDFTPEPENIRLLNVVADAASVWAPEPLKLTVPVPGLNTLPVPFHTVALNAFRLRVPEPPFNVPAVRVISPIKV